MSDKVAKGSCYCGAVQVECRGDPTACLVCHCRSCAKWGSINLATLYPSENVTITGDLVEYTNKPPEGTPQTSWRKTCAKCHSNVVNDHTPSMKLVDIVSGILDQEFKPAFHIHYKSATYKIKDGLPKFEDLPTDFGGSGTTMPE